MEWRQSRPGLRNQGKMTAPIMALRFRREPPMSDLKVVPPFTVMPEELRRGPFNLLKAARIVLNFLLLLVLSLLLVVLVLAFGYQIMTRPEVLGLWAIQLIASFQELVLSLLEMVHG